MDTAVLIIFVLVYVGMVFGRYPGLALDRTGIALLGAIAFLVLGRVGPQEAWDAVDEPTILLLLGLMVVSAQFRLGGFYSFVTRKLASADVSPGVLLALLIGVSGVLSAVLANDIVCLAMAPVLVEGCARRRLNPVPFLLALACAANVGSAATLIGNPQNMLIGQALDLSFTGYLIDASVPSVVGLAIVWAVIRVLYRNRWTGDHGVPHVDAPDLNVWQSSKGIVVIAALMIVFLFTGIPREVAALSAAGILLLSRRMESREILGLVDWHLLVLFGGLFIVNHVLDTSGVLGHVMEGLRRVHIDAEQPATLFVVTTVLSNLVSNVPATMLLLPSATHPSAGAILALSSTLAGNLFIVGSIANIIVVDQAQRLGIRITWAEHARTGLPVTVVTLAVAAAWLWIRSI